MPGKAFRGNVFFGLINTFKKNWASQFGSGHPQEVARACPDCSGKPRGLTGHGQKGRVVFFKSVQFLANSSSRLVLSCLVSSRPSVLIIIYIYIYYVNITTPWWKPTSVVMVSKMHGNQAINVHKLCSMYIYLY